jgi:thymidylate synthase (FAD)
MKAELIQYNPEGRDLLLLTKFTRLSQNSSDAMKIIKSWSEEKKMKELDYMLKTIESSWEFLVYTFSISGVSKALTHQLVRTRPDGNKHDVSYAELSMRTVTMENFEYTTPRYYESNPENKELFDNTMKLINDQYQKLLEAGVPQQDARGVLPSNIQTAIICKFDLRTLSHMMSERLCSRAQGEIQKLAFMMREEVLKVHPWAEGFLNVFCVSKGICRFENYHKCPIKAPMFDPNTGVTCRNNPEVPYEEKFDARSDKTRPANKSEIKSAWEKMNLNGGYEAIPDMQKK